MLRYLEIVRELEKIVSAMKPGDKLPDRNELCSRLNTTRTTIDKSIQDLAVRGILTSKKGSGTYVASNLDHVSELQINWCVIVPDISEAIYGQLVSGIEKVAQIYNANVILCNSNSNPTVQQRFIKRLLSTGVSGFIIVPVIQSSIMENYELYSILIRSKVPFVFCNRFVEGVRAPVVTSNDFYGGYIATKHLIKQGYRNIAFVAEHKYTTSMNRCQGYLSALLENSFEVNRKLIILPSTTGTKIDPSEQLRKLLLCRELDAVLCFNDAIALKTMQILNELELTVSDDVGLIGYDDTVAARECQPPLTSVSYKTDEIGQKAAEILYKRIIHTPSLSEFDYYLFQPEIIERESCKGRK